MAVIKASSQKALKAQVTKQPLTDLMDSIKEASSQRSVKSDFKNLLIPPQKPRGIDFKELKPETKVTPKIREGRETSTPNKTTESVSSPNVKTPEDQNLESPIISEPREDLILEGCSHPLGEPPFGSTELALPPQMITQNTLIHTSINTSENRLATINEHDIQAWINEGRVKIELQATTPIDQQQSIRQTETPLIQVDQNHSALGRPPAESSPSSSQESDESMAEDLLNPMIETSHKKSPLAAQQNPQIQQTPTAFAPFVQAQLAQDQGQSSSKPKLLQEISELKGQGLTTNGLKAPKAATLTAYDKLNALNQIKDQLKQALQKGETHLKIELKPHELGKVDIKLDISRDGVVTAMFRAENRETLETLTRHAVDFQNIFNDAGLQADSQGMNFSMSRDDQSESKSFAGPIRPDELILDEIKAAVSSGLLNPSTINILT